ncbi:MAG: TRAP transporter permease [Ignavibacteriales bacterium]
MKSISVVKYGLAVALSVIHLANFWVVFPSNILRGLHLAFVFALVYLRLAEKSTKAAGRVFNIVKAAVAVGACAYYAFNFYSLIERVTFPESIDQVIGILLIALVLDATSRTVGKGMGIVCAAFLAYMVLGRYLPGAVGHGGYGLPRMIGHLYLSSNGVFGSMIEISATYIAMFTLLGAFLEKSGASEAFINIALKATGRLQGGPALTAVIASCLFGTVSGSAVVNVIATGTFTIPLMKSIGVAPHVAGAVEAAASTGGQIMPPVMGAGAFIMSDITGVPYSTIVIRALIPALVYFFGVFMAVSLYVRRENIQALPEEQIPSWAKVRDGLYLLAPMVLVFIMIIMRYTPSKAAIVAIGVSAALIVLRMFSRPAHGVRQLADSLADGATGVSTVAMGLACAGLIIGVVTLTGLGAKFVSFVIAISNGMPLLALVFVAVACIILGMGLPTSAAYVITATLAVPALVEMGLPLFACHMFVFYFAVIAPITPPVAIAAYAGASIAHGDPNKTGWKAFAFALPAFLMPFMFVMNPLLLAEGSVGWILWALVSALLGATALSATTQGYFFGTVSLGERVVLGIAAVMLIDPGLVTDVIGLCVIAGMTTYRILKSRRREVTA